MDAERMAQIARKLEQLDNQLYDDVLEMIAYSRKQAVAEFKRELRAKLKAREEAQKGKAA